MNISLNCTYENYMRIINIVYFKNMFENVTTSQDTEEEREM